MYTQSYTQKPSETNIISFPNKDSILQMKLLESKSEPENVKHTFQNQSFSTASDGLLLLCTLMTVTENENTISDLFTIIAGMLLTL